MSFGQLTKSQKVFEVKGVTELKKLFEVFPASVAKRAKKAGLRKAGNVLKNEIKGDARKFKDSGVLTASIKVKVHKNGSVSVGLKDNFYYKLLDLNYHKNKSPQRPWFEESVDKHIGIISQIMINETHAALNVEAGKAYARATSKLRRR